MHDAYEIIPLNPPLKPGQIESLAAYGENLLVGTKQGHILKYSIVPQSPGEQKHNVQLLSCNRIFSKKPITQIEVVPEYDMLISLSDTIICVHDMKQYNFPVICTVDRTKGATLFVLDVQVKTSLTGETTTLVRMCASIKRKLMFFYWKKDKFLDFREDICLAEVPKSICWCEESIVVGFKGDYCIFHFSGEKLELFPLDKPQEQNVIKINTNKFAVLKESQTILLNTKGESVNKYPVKWTDIPTAMVFDDPYLIAIINEQIEVKTVIDPSLQIQTIPIAKGIKMIVRSKQGTLYMASPLEVFNLESIPISKQIKRLLQDKQFELALQLADISNESQEEKTKNKYNIRSLYAYDLFEKKQYQKSLTEFLTLGTDPYQVIQLFPDLVVKTNIGGSGGSSSDSPLLPSSTKILEQDLERALLALIEYLTSIRQKIYKKNDSETSDRSRINLVQIIDTTLLKCYLQTNDALVAPLVRLNKCHLGETEQTLRKYQKYKELIILYQTNNMHSFALKLLKEQSTIPESSLYGTDESIKYLQALDNSHMDLLLEHATWVLQANPTNGLRIFTEDVQEVEQLPRPRILDFLLRLYPSLAVPYLEHIINIWGETSDLLHNALVHQYRSQIQHLLSAGLDTDDLDIQTLRKKLLKFLETSRHYNPQVVIVQFPTDCLFEERAVILGKMGMHENAISIYMCTLNDINRAIKYCDIVYETKQEGYDMVYVLLMKMLIYPPLDPYQEMSGKVVTPMEPDVEKALSILEKNVNKVNALEVLKILPDDVPLARIQKFLHTSLQDILVERRQAQVLKGLLYAEHLQVQENRIALQSQSLTLTELMTCPVCKKKFSNQSAFARYPNGDIVHYSCQDKYQK